MHPFPIGSFRMSGKITPRILPLWWQMDSNEPSQAVRPTRYQIEKTKVTWRKSSISRPLFFSCVLVFVWSASCLCGLRPPSLFRTSTFAQRETFCYCVFSASANYLLCVWVYFQPQSHRFRPHLTRFEEIAARLLIGVFMEGPLESRTQKMCS